ncbi:hypothetical protein HO173_003311 [Letharia columbiana]|uniref:Uncharacterized protein n=1 Tax=Letharia columbiana TaxID=112416 RepID=A0A8H6G1I5_9LECA|nr:uncharacterized protein HO173_003311 [Letharia columbiana]KAF6238804.1 hypothetical protein HO173_003311 [Letharia columbiana]
MLSMTTANPMTSFAGHNNQDFQLGSNLGHVHVRVGSQPGGSSTLFDTASYTAGEDATIANSTWGSRSNTSDLSIPQQTLRGAPQPQLCLHWTRRNRQMTTKSLSTVHHPELAATTEEICHLRAGWIRQDAGMPQICGRLS